MVQPPRRARSISAFVNATEASSTWPAGIVVPPSKNCSTSSFGIAGFLASAGSAAFVVFLLGRHAPRRHVMPRPQKSGQAHRLARNFTPEAANPVWTGDITSIHTGEGWLYLAIVLDLFNREVAGWPLEPRMRAGIVIDTPTRAWLRRKPGKGVIFHSDSKNVRASCSGAA